MQRLLDRISEFLFRPPQEAAARGPARPPSWPSSSSSARCIGSPSSILGEMRMTVEDWPLQFMYGTVLKQAVTQHAMPWHTSREVLNTTRFLTIPETTLSPQVLALAGCRSACTRSATSCCSTRSGSSAAC